MTQVADWFERKFEFSFPVELYPNVCMRLWGTPARLEELVAGAARELLIRKPQEKWSAQEHAGHLLDLEPLWLARVEDFVKGGDELTAADLNNQKTQRANHNAREVKEILVNFRKSRSQFMRRVRQLNSELFAQTMLHPRLKKPMRLVDHMYFVAEHDDHHLAKIWELLR